MLGCSVAAVRRDNDYDYACSDPSAQCLDSYQLTSLDLHRWRLALTSSMVTPGLGKQVVCWSAAEGRWRNISSPPLYHLTLYTCSPCNMAHVSRVSAGSIVHVTSVCSCLKCHTCLKCHVSLCITCHVSQNCLTCASYMQPRLAVSPARMKGGTVTSRNMRPRPGVRSGLKARVRRLGSSMALVALVAL